MENSEKLRKIFDLTLKINDDDTKAEAHIGLSPHVNQISVYIYPQGWRYDLSDDAHAYLYAYYDGREYTGPSLYKLDDIIAALQSVLDGTFDVKDYAEEAQPCVTK